MADNLERVNQVYYTLFSNSLGIKIIQEPFGYSNDTPSFTRDKDSRGITKKINIELEFYGDASDYLKTIHIGSGIEEKVILTKYEKNRFTLSERFFIRYIQELDMGTFKEISRTGSVTVESTEGGIYTDITNRKSDEYDLLDNTSADGIDIEPLTTHKFQPLGRKIFLESLLESNKTGYRINSFRYNRLSSDISYTTRTIPLEITYSSDKDDVVNALDTNDANNLLEGNQDYALGTNMKIGTFFFFRAEHEKTLKITLDLDYKIEKVQSRLSHAVDFAVQLIETEKETDTENDKLVKATVLENFVPQNEIGVDKSISSQVFYVTVPKDGSLGFVFSTAMSYNGGFGDGETDVFVNVSKSKVVIEDITGYNDVITEGLCVKPFDLFDRIVAKITGKKGMVKSSIFEQGGEYENIVVDNGLLARGVPLSYENSDGDEQKMQMNLSFQDAFESFSYIEPLCWFPYIIGNKEYVRIEKATYTQQNFIGVSLGAVDKIENSSSKVDYFSSITLGHDKSLNYEEISGRDETNGKSEFSTFITKNESKYSFQSKLRTDAIGYELTRRIRFETSPKKDTRRDNDLWMHDAKKIGDTDIITHRKWNDTDIFNSVPKGFDSLPTGIYHPESSWNLNFSPMNRLFYGHGYSIKRGLYHYPSKKITFSSSNANQNMITIKDGFSLAESGNLTISDIPKPRIEAKKTSFTFKMTQELENKFAGFTDVNGDLVPNFFGLIEYLEKGEKRYGRLVKLESSDEAKITLINARL